MELRNFMEEFVREILEDILAVDKDICGCDECRLDVAAMALNRLPPKYVVSEKGRAFTKMESFKFQFQADVVREVGEAIRKVKEHPRHMLKPEK